MNAEIPPAGYAVKWMPIEKLTPFPFDLREHDLGAITASLSTFGQAIPIVCVEHEGRNVIIAGKGRYLAAKALGWPGMLVHFEPWAPAMAGAFAIADNRTHERGTVNLDPLAQLLAELRREDETLFRATGFDDEDLVRMAADLEREAERDAAALGADPSAPKPKMITCPECGHKFTVKKGR